MLEIWAKKWSVGETLRVRQHLWNAQTMFRGRDPSDRITLPANRIIYVIWKNKRWKVDRAIIICSWHLELFNHLSGRKTGRQSCLEVLVLLTLHWLLPPVGSFYVGSCVNFLLDMGWCCQSSGFAWNGCTILWRSVSALHSCEAKPILVFYRIFRNLLVLRWFQETISER